MQIEKDDSDDSQMTVSAGSCCMFTTSAPGVLCRAGGLDQVSSLVSQTVEPWQSVELSQTEEEKEDTDHH